MDTKPAGTVHRCGPGGPRTCDCSASDIDQARGTTLLAVAEVDYPTEWCLPHDEETDDVSRR